MHRTTTSEGEKGDSISLRSPVSLLLYPLNPLLCQRLSNNKEIQKRRQNKYIAEGWKFFFCSHLLQSTGDYHSYRSYRFLFLLVPSRFIVIISPAFSLQNVSATSLYRLPGAVPYASSGSSTRQQVKQNFVSSSKTHLRNESISATLPVKSWEEEICPF